VTLSEQLQCPIEKLGIIWFAIGFWYCFDSVVSFVNLFDFGTVPTM
jgi:hypothetical protein